MAGLIPAPKYHVRLDEETGRQVVCVGNMEDGGPYTVLGHLAGDVLIRGTEGDEAEVTKGGSLRIIQHEIPDWYGLPQYMVDAAANGDDSYYDLGVAIKDCASASLYVETNDAIVSFDGGTTDHFFLDVGAGQVLLTGLDIPAGSTISGKNAVVASDYTNLRIAIW
jgi:hypothetical protein